MDRKLIPIIKLIQRTGQQVVFIDNTYFVISEFIPADEMTFYHSLVGIDVTELIHNHIAVVHTDQTLIKKTSEIIKSMLQTVVETQRFHRETPFRWFLKTN